MFMYFQRIEIAIKFVAILKANDKDFAFESLKMFFPQRNLEISSLKNNNVLYFLCFRSTLDYIW